MNNIELSDLPLDRTVKQYEYRVYYNDDGSIITYTTDNLSGRYLVITKEEYARADHTMVVIDNKLYSKSDFRTISKYIKSGTGIKTSKYSINIIDNSEDSNCWEYVTLSMRKT
jgi:hypothetical protein